MPRKLVVIFLMFNMLVLPLVHAQDSNFTLTLMHTNDTHAHHEPNRDDVGGVARQAAVVKQIRTEVENSLLLDAGDRFTGSVLHTLYQGQDNVQIMNALGYDAMTLGSYEFTHGADVLADFITQLDFPVVTSNVDFSASERLAGAVSPYVVLDVGGEQIGILGVTRADSRIRPIPELVYSSDYATIAQAAVDELTAQGINKIILLSHLNYFDDLGLATQLTGIDVIVGANSNTFLSNTDPDAEGPYPTVIQNAADQPVLVVQAYYNNEVMGRLDVTFDAEGVPIEWGGDAIVLTTDIEPDPDMVALVETLREPLGDFLNEVVGETQIRLDGEEEKCRFEECNLGNLIADALRAATGAQIAIHNGGAIRASIESGEITVGEVLEVLPFSNTYLIFEITGAEVVEALENSVSRTDATEGTGRFMQVSGLRFSWDGSREAGRRIVGVEVMDENGNFSQIDPFEIYTIAVNDFIFSGADEYNFNSQAMNAGDFGLTLDTAVRDYITANSPINPQIEGRITRIDR